MSLFSVLQKARRTSRLCRKQGHVMPLVRLPASASGSLEGDCEQAPNPARGDEKT